MSRLISKSQREFLKGSPGYLLHSVAFLVAASLGLVGCASSEQPQTDPLLTARLVSELETVQKSNREILAENHATSEHLALLKTEVTSLKEQQASIRRQLEVVKRGARSGLYEEQNAGKSSDKKPDKPLLGIDVPAIKSPDTSTGRNALALPFSTSAQSQEGIGDKATVDDRMESDEQNTPDSSAGMQASQLLADAQLKMQRANYGEAVVVLAQLQKENPNFEDNGTAALLLAECWLKLGQPENALPVLRSFYLKHPQSPDLLRAKLLEARVLEKSGAREKALVVYREVLALGPETAFARDARTALGRMRDAR